MNAMKPKLKWTLDNETYLLVKHRVRRDTMEALLNAEDLSLVGSRFGRLMLQGSVEGKCYRLIVEVVDPKELVFEPVTGYRYAAGDQKKGGVG